MFKSILATLFFALSANVALAGVTIDQYHDTTGDSGRRLYEVSNGTKGGLGLFQTFTVGVDGLLSRIGIQVVRAAGLLPTEDLTVTIWSTDGAIPEFALGSLSIERGSISVVDTGSPPAAIEYVYADVSSMGITAIQGEKLAINLFPGNSRGYYWAGVSPASKKSTGYAGGDGLHGFSSRGGIGFSPSGADYGFETYMDDGSAGSPVPEPSSVALLGIGIAGLIGYGRRRHKRSVPKRSA